jgi:hypothetical protein
MKFGKETGCFVQLRSTGRSQLQVLVAFCACLSVLCPIYDDNGVMWVPYQQSFYPGWGGLRRSALDRISRHTQDRWTPRQIGQGHLADPVRQPPTGGQTAQLRREQFPPKKVYKPKIREEEVQKMDINP